MTVLTGCCTCGATAYVLSAPPLVTHCCHCTWCQRESGSAFALNAVIEVGAFALTRGRTVAHRLPSASGNGQVVHRCGGCGVTLYSLYSRPFLLFVRVGTLDDPAEVEPDLHIFTSTKQPWVRLPEGARAFAEYYDPRVEWSAEATARFLGAKEEAGF